MRILRLAAVFMWLPVLGLAACDPTGFRFDPLITADTVALVAPDGATDTLPTALDVTAPPGGLAIRGGRFPQRTSDATEWDLAIRREDGELVFLPAGAAGLGDPALDRAAITRPITERSFDSIDEAPTSSDFVSDSTVVIRQGAAYVVRSRSVPGCGSQYAKIFPIAINPDSGTVSIHVTTNARCGDRRLIEN